MKNSFLYHVLIVLLLSACSPTSSEEIIVDSSIEQVNEFEYGDKTLELIKIVDKNPVLKALLVKSIEQAKAINPDKQTNPAQSLEEYYQFVTWAEKAMPWTLIKNTEHFKLYDKIDQGLSYFFFICDQPLEELEGKGYFKNSLQYDKVYSKWLSV